MNSKPRQLNSSLDRGLHILDLFSRTSRTLNAKEIANHLEIAPTTLYPFLNTLVARGYLEMDEAKRYHLGLKLLERAGEVNMSLDLRTVAKQGLETLSRSLKANTRLGVLYKHEVLYLERYEGGPDAVIGEIVGVCVPAYCTSLGKVLLAYLPDEDRERVVRSLAFRPLTQNTITCPDRLLKELKRVREKGFSIESEEFHLGGACVGAPVRTASGKVVAAVSVSTFASRAQGQELKDIAEAVKSTAAEVSARLGFCTEEKGGDEQAIAS